MESAKCIVDRFNVDYEAAKPQGASPPASGVQQADPALERAARDEVTWSVSVRLVCKEILSCCQYDALLLQATALKAALMTTTRPEGLGSQLRAS